VDSLDLYESAGQKLNPGLGGGRLSAGGDEPFAVAWGGQIAHTVSLETIEYCGGQNSFDRRRGPPPGGIIIPRQEGEWLE